MLSVAPEIVAPFFFHVNENGVVDDGLGSTVNNWTSPTHFVDDKGCVKIVTALHEGVTVRMPVEDVSDPQEPLIRHR